MAYQLFLGYLMPKAILLEEQLWYYLRFGLVWFLCFNGISTLFRLFNAKAILLEEQLWYYLTHSCEDKGVHTFPKEYLCESERNSATGVRTRVLWFRSPSL